MNKFDYTFDDLIQGVEIDNSLSAIYSYSLTRQAQALAQEIVNLQNIADEYIKVQVGSRVYDVHPDFIRYYSINGRRKFYDVTSIEQIYRFLSRPTKTRRTVKIIA